MYKNRFGNAQIHMSDDGRIMNGEREATYPSRGHARYPGPPLPPLHPQPRYGPRSLDRSPPPSRRYDDPIPRDRPRLYRDQFEPPNRNSDPLDYDQYDRRDLIPYPPARRYHSNLRRIASLDWPYSFVFILLATVLFIMAAINTTICEDDYFFSGWWGSLMVFVLGAAGLAHRGDYKSALKSSVYILFGIISTCTSFAAISLILSKYIPQTQFLANAPIINYINLQIAEGNLPRMNVSNNEARAWTCLGTTTISLFTFTLSLMSLTAAAYVFVKYWNKNWKEPEKQIEPVCTPFLFNPFSQLPFGQALVVIGFVTISGTIDSQWDDYWAPVWSGAMIIVAGCFGGVSLRIPKYQFLLMISIGVQIIALLTALVTIALMVPGIVDNVRQVQDTQLTTPDRDRRIASAVIFSAATATGLVNAALCIGVLVRLTVNSDRIGNNPIFKFRKEKMGLFGYDSYDRSRPYDKSGSGPPGYSIDDHPAQPRFDRLPPARPQDSYAWRRY